MVYETALGRVVPSHSLGGRSVQGDLQFLIKGANWRGHARRSVEVGVRDVEGGGDGSRGVVRIGECEPRAEANPTQHNTKGGRLKRPIRRSISAVAPAP